MSKHTPGPWRQSQDYEVRHSDSNNLIAMATYSNVDSVDPNRMCALGNARLIAAAPELLQFAKGCEDWLASLPAEIETRHMLYAVREAIAKATGGE